MEVHSQYYKELVIKHFELFEKKFKEVLFNPKRRIEFKLNGYRITIIQNINYVIHFYDEIGEFIDFLLLKVGSRKINFIKTNNSNWEFIFGTNDIRKYIEKYQIDHPTYHDKIKNKNISFSSRDYDNIFCDKNITEIFDNEF